MTELEERLRQELNDMAHQLAPADLRPLREPAPRAWSRRARWLAPVAAAAALAGVIAGLHLTGLATSPRPASPRMPALAADGTPRFYVRLVLSDRSPATTAVVADARTGQTITTVQVPGTGQSYLPQVAAAADDRTFVILTAAGPSRSLATYLLHVSGNGHSANLTQAPVKQFTYPLGVTGIALSPDGTELATTREKVGPYGTALLVTSLTTGATRTWATSAPGGPTQPNWIDHGTKIAFSWNPPLTSGGQTAQVRVLNTADPGSDLMASKVIVTYSLAGFGSVGVLSTALVTPNGRAVIVSQQLDSSNQGVSTVNGRTVWNVETFKIVELSARSGRVLRVLREVRMRASKSCAVLSLGPVGVHPLVQCPQVGALTRSGTFTRLRGYPTLFLGNYAW